MSDLLDRGEDRAAVPVRLNVRLMTAVAVLAAAASLFGAITYDVVDKAGITRSDSRLLRDLVGHSSGSVSTGLAKGLTFLGTGFALYSVVAVLGFLVWRRTRSALLPVLCLAWLAVGQSLRLVISHLVARARPPQNLHLVKAAGFAFPSGHTATATIGYGLAAVLVLALAPSRRLLVIGGAAVLAVMVGFSRVYLGVHWPSDVLGGWAFGIGWLTFAAVIAISLPRTRVPRSPPAVHS